MECFTRWRGWLAVLGGVLIHLTLGTIYTYGNMSPYIMSYVRTNTDSGDVRYQQSTLIFALTIFGQGLAMPFGGLLEKKLGPRLTTLLGSWLMSCGVMLSCLSVQNSYALLVLTYGFMFGVGVGIAYISPLVCAMKWMPERKGLINGFVVGGFGGGAFIFDQVQTAYINPHNLTPNVTLPNHPGEKYFGQEEILAKVPSCFLLIGGIYALIQLIGVLLLAEPPEDFGITEASELVKSSVQAADTVSTDSGAGYVMEPQTIPDSELDSKSSGLNLSPRELVKTRAFWTLWFAFLFQGQGQLFVSTLYKAFGQSFIKDDSFLAIVGAFSALFNAGGRLFWGALADMFSFRAAMLTLCSTFAVLMLTFMATPDGGNAMFFIWVCALFFTFGGNFSLFPTATARAFGTEHVGTNYGLLFTNQCVTGPVGAFLTILLKDAIGWFGMFGLIAAFSLISFLLTWSFNIKRPNGLDI
ncbi:apicoplast pyruvate carrier 1-like [Amphiura filiformis]|uniref:apicoplast pyruvate carrier 1-like n=1 Tax=Amphiura filiformis TaxID=82378 RepID=UPI003B216374